MKPRIMYQIRRQNGGDVENIDVHDLPEEEAQMVAAFVEFLRRRRKRRPQDEKEARVPPPGQKAGESRFAEWALGVKEPLTRQEIYEYL
jgi:hypothetical protein